MSSTSVPCGIHKIRELQLPLVDLTAQYDVIREIGSGDYGKVLLAIHRKTGSQVALKAVPKLTTPIKDFLIEFHYSYFLSPHHGVLDTYDVAFETPEHYFFAQEVATLGDMWQAVERTGGLEEKDLKIVCKQIVSALEFLHEKELVHRDVRAENILLFQSDFTKVKLTDFGLTRRAGTLVKKRTRSLPTCPPEIWETVHLEGYSVETGSDVWQMAMLVYTALTGKFPWEKADITDPLFVEFVDWQKRKTTRTPRRFKGFSPRMLRMFRRMMDPKPSKRYPVTEVNKYYGDRWLMMRSPRASMVGGLTIPPGRGLETSSTSGSLVDETGHLIPVPGQTLPPQMLSAISFQPQPHQGGTHHPTSLHHPEGVSGSGATAPFFLDGATGPSGGGGGVGGVPKDEMLGELLTNYGLEIRVNKNVREQRIHDWIMSSPDQDSP